MINGQVWKLGNNIDTDMIISGKYLNSEEPSFLAQKCFEELEEGWSKKISQGDILVAGKNFGCGSSREHAVIALKATGISSIIAESFGSIFFRNAINLGLSVFELEAADLKFTEGDIAQIEAKTATITNNSKEETYKVVPMPTIVMEILQAGGLIEYIESRKQVNGSID
jgi:3-isopropylmalate/(R)-2-methylmalate dehydratase small subunit